jgi:hypothetical protein
VIAKTQRQTTEKPARNQREITEKLARKERQKVTLLRYMNKKINKIISAKKISFDGHGGMVPILCLRAGFVWRRNPSLGQRRTGTEIFLTENWKPKKV